MRSNAFYIRASSHRGKWIEIIAASLLTSLPATALASSSRTIFAPTGASASDFFGSSVSSAGDVNGDGYADVIVGAHLNSAAGTYAGRAYVYYGGPGPDAIPDLTLTGAAAWDLFGISVSSGGDVNGDGYADVIVGAPQNDAGGTDAGRAYLYYGGPGADAVPDLILTGVAAGDNFGNSVSSAGDVNGDGYSDLIVGAPSNDAVGADAGRAYVFYGGPGADAVPDLILTGVAAGDNFGGSVSSARDVNGDGYADLIVGANQFAGGALIMEGRAYVYYGGPGADPVPDMVLAGVAAGDEFGNHVSSGDVNKDGYSDVIVGAPGNDAAGVDAGRAYVYYGGPGADAVADLTLTGEAAGHNFGARVTSAGDMDRDGSDDVIAGAHYAAGAGRAYVYYGGSGADAVPELTLTGAAAGDFFGNSVSSAGDVNRDGYSDVIVGAPLSDAAFTDAGQAYIISISLPDVTTSFFVPQSGSVSTPTEGAAAIANARRCPNDDGTQVLRLNSRLKIKVLSSDGSLIPNIPASDICVLFNGGPTSQGFSGVGDDSIIANYQYNQAANCPDVRCVQADAPTDLSGTTYITWIGSTPGSPGVGTRDPLRKWGGWAGDLPVFVLGIQIHGKLTSGSPLGSYTAHVKSLDFTPFAPSENQGELVNSLDIAAVQGAIGGAYQYKLDFDNNGVVNSVDLSFIKGHNLHRCNSPIVN